MREALEESIFAANNFMVIMHDILTHAPLVSSDEEGIISLQWKRHEKTLIIYCYHNEYYYTYSDHLTEDGVIKNSMQFSYLYGSLYAEN